MLTEIADIKVIILTGWKEVIFYVACAFIAICFFAAVLRLINDALDWLTERKYKKAVLEKNRADELLVREIEKKIELYQSWKSANALSKGDKQILDTKIAALEDVVEHWNNNKKYHKN